jgi:hypothetical protein
VVVEQSFKVVEVVQEDIELMCQDRILVVVEVQNHP